MTAEKLMVELILHLEKLSDAEIITEYGIDYIQFMADVRTNMKKIRSARIYIPVGNSHICMN